jgi:hypothetical protein
VGNGSGLRSPGTYALSGSSSARSRGGSNVKAGKERAVNGSAYMD